MWTSYVLVIQDCVHYIFLASYNLHGHQYFAFTWEATELKLLQGLGWEEAEVYSCWDFSPYSWSMCGFCFFSKPCEPKNVYPAPVPCIWLTVVVSSNINISWLFILTHTDVLERRTVAGRTMWKAVLDIWCHLQLELYCSKKCVIKSGVIT